MTNNRDDDDDLRFGALEALPAVFWFWLAVAGVVGLVVFVVRNI